MSDNLLLILGVLIIAAMVFVGALLRRPRRETPAPPPDAEDPEFVMEEPESGTDPFKPVLFERYHPRRVR